MKYQYTTCGTCSREIDIDIEGGVIRDVRFIGGCQGNTQGVAALVRGLTPDQVIARLEGIQCGSKRHFLPRPACQSPSPNAGGMISVIIPVYNVEEYLPACLDSVRGQTYTDWETILVDDGSTDSSAAICDDAAAGDPRFKVIRQKNSGQSAARNAGVAAAGGEYITFIDSDDVVDDRYLEYLLRLCVDNHTLISSVAFRTFRKKPLTDKSLDRFSTECMPGRKGVERMLYQRMEPSSSPCAKLFHSSLRPLLKFRVGSIYEDLDLMPCVLEDMDNVAVSAAPLYHYRMRPGSTLHSFSLRRADVLDVVVRLHTRYLDMSSENPDWLSVANAAADRRFSAAYNILLLTLRERRRASRVKLSPDYICALDAIVSRCRAEIAALAPQTRKNPLVRAKNRFAAFIFPVVALFIHK